MKGRRRIVESIARMMREKNLVTEMGMDVDYDKRVVTFTDAHERGVNTSLRHPVIDTETIPGVTVYSIFQRNDRMAKDGNPLINALKGSSDDPWTIPEDNRRALLERARKILDIFCEAHRADFTIVVPSRGKINPLLAELVRDVTASHGQENVICTDFLEKMTVEEVVNELFTQGSLFMRTFNTNVARENAWNDLRPAFAAMERDNGGIFSYKMVKPASYRKYVTSSLRLSSDPHVRETFEKMPGKDILIIDDTITFGNTVSSAASLVRDTVENVSWNRDIIENYAPRSISALTMFSVKKLSSTGRRNRRKSAERYGK